MTSNPIELPHHNATCFISERLDIFWLKDQSLEDSENLPDPEILVTEITENLESALEQLGSIYQDLERE